MIKRLIALLTAAVFACAVPVIAVAEESYVINVGEAPLLVNGEAVTGEVSVSGTDELMFDCETALVVKTEEGYYLPNEVFFADSDMDLSSAFAIYKTGLSMVNGAQVRIGQETLEEGEKIDALSDSGLRFIALANYTDSIIADGSLEFGMKLHAQDSDNVVYVEATGFQDDNKTIFSVAIRNLLESNYNRKYSAQTYVKVPLVDGRVIEFNSDKVWRSVYQVAVGLMKTSVGEANSDLPYTVDDGVKNVLNAYINQTGIRLTYNPDGSVVPRLTGNGKYTGGLFFDVEYCVLEDGSTDVTIIPYGEADGFNNSVSVASWWEDYVRINNNNSQVVDYISDVRIEDGILTFNFKVPENTPVTDYYSFNEDDDVLVVSYISDNCLEGFKAGEEVSYEIIPGVKVCGISKEFSDITPGSVVFVGETEDGKCAAIQLLATIGAPVNGDLFQSHIGVYDDSFGTGKYTNIVGEMFSKSGIRMQVKIDSEGTKESVAFASTKTLCYKVEVAVSEEGVTVSCEGKKVSTTPSIFEGTDTHYNYLYLRKNNETGKITQCVYYTVSKNLDFTGGGEYTKPFDEE